MQKEGFIQFVEPKLIYWADISALFFATNWQKESPILHHYPKFN
jgi:hypothetical protein